MKLSTIIENAEDILKRVIKNLDIKVDSEMSSIDMTYYMPALNNDKTLIGRWLVSCDPTTTYRFIPYIISLFNQGRIKMVGGTISRSQIVATFPFENRPWQLIFPEDIDKLKEKLALIDNAKELLKRNKWEDGSNIDLNLVGKNYDYIIRLEERIHQLRGTKRGGGGFKAAEYPGTETILNDGTYTVYYVPQNDAQALNSLQKLGLGTDWCTREDYGNGVYAGRYLNASPVYTTYKNSKPFMQCHFGYDRYTDPAMLNVLDKPEPLPEAVFKAIKDDSIARGQFNGLADVLQFNAKYNPDEKNIGEAICEYVSEINTYGRDEIELLRKTYFEYVTTLGNEVGLQEHLDFAKASLIRDKFVEENYFKNLSEMGIKERWTMLRSYLQNVEGIHPVEDHWPEAAEFVAASTTRSYQYAILALGGRWTYGEKPGSGLAYNEYRQPYEIDYINDYRRRNGLPLIKDGTEPPF
jgi:hypothetical protein